MIGDSITSALYQKALDGTWQRQKAISNNIANSETPGYKSVEVNFEDSLNSAMQTLQGNSSSAKSVNAIENAKVSVNTRASSSKLDQNNVDIESENIDMTKTQLQYYYLVQGISNSYSRLKYAISGGK
ncbi:flagellar basal body rod protein FlgB [Acetobacterium paludosum]|uniref:Flagellar basal body rod protein FlgB n=1 Tax=Acetobacterium paludosum TaxID=52693 RepID=A0A923I379_9FIRM|nr:flagellar basal body rod protein FlgB [Acetobacterium paludosum]MBC3888255.1 flagellar basal body rod protein FlgB [Acetobacterium paludosum]